MYVHKLVTLKSQVLSESNTSLEVFNRPKYMFTRSFTYFCAVLDNMSLIAVRKEVSNLESLFCRTRTRIGNLFCFIGF